MWQIISGVFLGWSLGANDASNVFGTAVASRMVKFWTAAILCSVFVLLGAVLQGSGGMHTYKNLSSYGLNFAFIVSLSGALTVTVMTIWGLPVSTSQAVVGSMVAMGMLRNSIEWGGLTKVVLCWIGTPVGAMLIAIILYYVVGEIFNRIDFSLFMYDRVLRWGLIIAGSYGAYALGANNVANVTGPFVASGEITPQTGALIGGLSIGLGVITFSRTVMMTVGAGLVKLNAFSAFVVVLAEAITVHIYAEIGVPVSTSQAVVGAVLGIGIIRGVKTVNFGMLARIIFGWIGTPAISFALTWGITVAVMKAGIL
ncbi:inorganic phosphate transporter family protein [Myxococcota bacterium]|nr:inorganic phosphate transporter family protein [Myxococcota bacterium]MBU1380315.1 inorganic phosphate transporter family protein [Myxococcota bacterium]MBU1495303.1 inorganic phosphate transporter family protein [Myxococcota bacterium]